ncbi:transposase [Dyadobacter sp. LHD-138]|uniref:IS110 family transposase n=1 Tax=Dyadobacter sp. LHD-138 TaxID=3071413 RepID=UPI0027E213AD|nr:transposase [Dyadobacter sp. LHD-138]MDQ6482053.1 transposase [Dyadobacter sp. LHD-138]
MEKEWFIGVDISKLTLDFALCNVNNPNQFIHRQFANCTLGFKKMLIGLKKDHVTSSNSLFCMEHTGHYTLALCCFLQNGNFPFTKVSPLHLKKSLGLIRGKNDKIDAKRIAQFACLHHRMLKPMQLPSACLLKLKNLVAFRDRLVKTSVSLKMQLRIYKIL